ncbi:hypothetical protein AVEN_80008-1 [Araneus ventricosus]|uniref:Uncharacterized protein n=1 Tax=Araneus ventricosus TaxID=182803 RepID=A0A4Y2FM13_ARAVE|nr:hypothetical protein AVEN_80008-1 [Araneus ventricosus]
MSSWFRGKVPGSYAEGPGFKAPLFKTIMLWDTDRYYLRMLLLDKSGAVDFDDLKTVIGILCETAPSFALAKNSIRNRRILAARDKKTKNSRGLRFFNLPKLKFEAADYIDLIDWSKCLVTEPPLTMHIKDKDLREMCEEEQFPVLTFEEFLYHTQPFERCVKIISEAAMKDCGETARDGYIRGKLQARRELPMFDNKGQY